jgi:hypothetical protein
VIHYTVGYRETKKGQNMNKIKKISKYIVVALHMLMFLIPCLAIYACFLEPLGIKPDIVSEVKGLFLGYIPNCISTPEGCVNATKIEFSTKASFINFLGSLIKITPWLIGILFLKKLFTNYGKAIIFSKSNVKIFKKLGILLVIDAIIADPISRSLEILAITMNNPPGHRWITISFGGINVMELFCSVMVITIAWVMHEATKIQEENKFII